MSQSDTLRWEYEVVSMSDQLPDAAVKAALNDLGARGWELTGLHVGAAGCPRYIFKRGVSGVAPVPGLGPVVGLDSSLNQGGPDDEQERWLRNASIAEALTVLPVEKQERLLAQVLTDEERQMPSPPADFYERVISYFAKHKDEG